MLEPGPIIGERVVTGEAALSYLYTSLDPEVVQCCYPRRYISRPDYPDPRHFAVCAYTQAVNVADPFRQHDETAVYTFCASQKVIKLGVPTYYVGCDLAAALSMTSPPENMAVTEILWPLDGLMFMVPTEFSLRYFGRKVLYIAVAKMLKNEQVVCPFSVHSKYQPQISQIASDAVIIGASTVNDGRVEGFHGIIPLRHDKTLAELAHAPFQYYGDEVDAPGEDKVASKLISAALSYLLVMTHAPEFVEPACCLRKGKVKKGRVRDELWDPHFIGKTYAHSYERTPKVDHGGTHASPRAHWRLGHWRNQPYGPGLFEVKRLWIKPVFVNPDANA